MSERFSVLKPLGVDQLEKLMLDILVFFSPKNSLQRNEHNAIVPNSVNDFLKVQEEKGFKDIQKYQQQIIALIKKLEQNHFLCSAGYGKGFTLGGEKSYYFIRELSTLQSQNLMWFGECLGLEYIQYKAKKFVVPITGVLSDGDFGIGTGTLINSDTILTCAHVLDDMKVDESILIGGQEVKILYHKSHTSVDVGIVKLSQNIDTGFQMVFGDTYILDEILTMGYPPVPMTIDAYLVSQKGEINSIVQNYDRKDYFLYSSITRPGNSGGPIFNKRGHLIGMSARHLEHKGDEEKNIIPFFQGIPSRVILESLLELDADLQYQFENYD